MEYGDTAGAGWDVASRQAQAAEAARADRKKTATLEQRVALLEGRLAQVYAMLAALSRHQHKTPNGHVTDGPMYRK